MTHDATVGAADLIGHILAHFHETHRRELPEIVRLARAVELHGAPQGIADRFAAMGDALEQHMFKEEMRLFPMMEQGGSTLIGHLIDDMRREHGRHRDAMVDLQADLYVLRAPLVAQADLAALRRAVGKLFDDLTQHMHAEDDLLFPMFVGPQKVATSN